MWQSSAAPGACRLATLEGYKRSYELCRGLSLAAAFPKNARAPMAGKGTLTDDLSNTDGIKVCSMRLVELLQGAGVAHVEYLPVTILDAKCAVASKDYRIVNPVGLVDALDRAASKPKYNLLDKEQIDFVRRTVLDPSKLDPARRVFRLAGFRRPVFIDKKLADALLEAGMVGSYFHPLESFAA